MEKQEEQNKKSIALLFGLMFAAGVLFAYVFSWQTGFRATFTKTTKVVNVEKNVFCDVPWTVVGCENCDYSSVTILLERWLNQTLERKSIKVHRDDRAGFLPGTRLDIP